MTLHWDKIFPLAMVIAVASILAGGYAIYDYPWEVIRFPLLTGAGVILLCLILLFRPEARDCTKSNQETPSKSSKGVLWVFMVIPFLLLAGFNLGFPLYALVYVYVHTRQWRSALAVAGIVFCIVFGLFSYLLKYPLPSPYWLTFINH